MIEVICCVCAKVKHGEEWVQGTPAAGANLSHGYCPDCTEKALAELRSLRLRASKQDPRAVA